MSSPLHCMPDEWLQDLGPCSTNTDSACNASVQYCANSLSWQEPGRVAAHWGSALPSTKLSATLHKERCRTHVVVHVDLHMLRDRSSVSVQPMRQALHGETLALEHAAGSVLSQISCA